MDALSHSAKDVAKGKSQIPAIQGIHKIRMLTAVARASQVNDQAASLPRLVLTA